MTRHRTWFRALVTAACWLALFAGADDFNLARVVLPLPASAPDSPLPLDDPNTDFTESSQAGGPTTAQPGRRGHPVSAGRKAAGKGPAAPVASSAPRTPLRAGVNAPLRC
jgi:hypothetical protein